MLTRGVHKALRSDAERLAAEAQADGASVYFINGDRVVDRDSFFDAVRSTSRSACHEQLQLGRPIRLAVGWIR